MNNKIIPNKYKLYPEGRGGVINGVEGFWVDPSRFPSSRHGSTEIGFPILLSEYRCRGPSKKTDFEKIKGTIFSDRYKRNIMTVVECTHTVLRLKRTQPFFSEVVRPKWSIICISNLNLDSLLRTRSVVKSMSRLLGDNITVRNWRFRELKRDHETDIFCTSFNT